MYATRELIRIQERIKRKIILEDVLPARIKTIAGVDQTFLDKDRIISAIVACDSRMDVIEKRHIIMKIDFPYVPGFLSFREGPAIIKAFLKLKNKPHILIVNGCGINHPRYVGLASHVGVLLDVTTIGVTQNILCGEYHPEPINVGDFSIIYYRGKKVGFVLKSKENCNPIFISSGHKISLDSSLEIIKKCMGKHKLPIPLQIAHAYANELKEKYINVYTKTKKPEK